MEGPLVSALDEFLRQYDERAESYAAIPAHTTSTREGRRLCMAAALGAVEGAFRVVYAVIGAPALRAPLDAGRFSIFLIDAVVCASATGNEHALRELLQACRDRGETLSIPVGGRLAVWTRARWESACTALCIWIAQGPLNAISLAYLDVLDLNTRWVSGCIPVMYKLASYPSSPTLVEVMRTFPPEAWMPVPSEDGTTAGDYGPLDVMYAHNEQLLMDMLPHIPDAAFARHTTTRPPVVCSKRSTQVSMSAFRAVWERSQGQLDARDIAQLCGFLLAFDKTSMHLQLDLVLSSLSDDARMEACRLHPNGAWTSYAAILTRVTRAILPPALAVVLEHILDAPQKLRLMARSTLSNLFHPVDDTDPRQNTEDVLRLLIEACVDERALAARDAVALFHNWYIGDGSRLDNMQLYMWYVSPEFLDYMLTRIPLGESYGNQRYCDWLRAAAMGERHDVARVIERHLPRRAEIRQCMEEVSPAYAAIVYPVLAKRAACT